MSADHRTLLQRAFVELKNAQARLDAAERAKSEPSAIIGMGCRFPGGVDSPEAFWRLLCDGVDAITDVPPGRWNAAELFDTDPDAPGKMTTRWGGFVENVDRFDAAFFGIAPREAVWMDPQQRLLLEAAWDALGDAGVATDDWRAAARACSSASAIPIIRGSTKQAPMPWMRTPAPGTLTASRPDASRICWIFADRRWHSTPRARRRWLRFIWRCRVCEPVNATSQWQAA